MRVFIKTLAVTLAAVIIVAAVSAYRPVVDAGHGGFDGGAVAADGTVESELNLQIARRLEYMLYLLGYQPVMVRSDESALADGDTIRAAKSADLKRRVEIADSTEDGFLISIHQNSFGDSRYGGAQTFWSHEEAKALAELIQFTIRTQIDSENERAAKTVPQDVYLFKQTVRPAVLIECGFLTNTQDLERLGSEEYQLRLACVIAGCFACFDRNNE